MTAPEWPKKSCRPSLRSCDDDDSRTNREEVYGHTLAGRSSKHSRSYREEFDSYSGSLRLNARVHENG